MGHEAAKFTPEKEAEARRIISGLLSPGDMVVSGHCPLGGIDIWAEEITDVLGLAKLIFPPAINQWEGGYKQRNLQIARNCDRAYCLVVKELPVDYKGMRFARCYHCNSTDHIKSGGCWTVKQAMRLGVPGEIICM